MGKEETRMTYELIPTIQSNQTDRLDVFYFTIGNIGFKIRLEAGLFERCLSVFIQPVALAPHSTPKNPIWLDVGDNREFLLPMPTHETLLQYAKNPFDHIQWGVNSVKLFWQRDVLQISTIKTENSFILKFKKMYWDGASQVAETGIRKVYSVNESKEEDYSINIANGLTRENFDLLIERNQLIEDEEYNRFMKKEKQKERVNKLLNHIGLQVRETT